MARTIALKAALQIGLLAAIPASAQPPAECAELARDVRALRKQLSEARSVLNDFELNCAFRQFTLGGSAEPLCQKTRTDAESIPEKRRAWSDAYFAWARLDRALLTLRAEEDRRGIVCP